MRCRQQPALHASQCCVCARPLVTVELDAYAIAAVGPVVVAVPAEGGEGQRDVEELLSGGGRGVSQRRPKNR